MIQYVKESGYRRPRLMPRIPPQLEAWAREQGLCEYRWLEIIAPEYNVVGDVLYALEERLPFVLETEGYRYYAGVSNHPRLQCPTCFWYGIPV